MRRHFRCQRRPIWGNRKILKSQLTLWCQVIPQLHIHEAGDYEMPDLPSSCGYQLVSLGLGHDRQHGREYEGESQDDPDGNRAGEDHPCDREPVE